MKNFMRSCCTIPSCTMGTATVRVDETNGDGGSGARRLGIAATLVLDDAMAGYNFVD